jgi:hypothetical protein
MKSSVPPVFATWLLKHLSFSNTDDALVGDLLEEFSQRRSAAWYWRQVLVAILVGFGKTVRHHWALVIRAVACGFAVGNIAALVLRFIIVTAPRGVVHVSASSRHAPWFLTSFVSGVIGGFLIAWLAASRHPNNRRASLPTFVGDLITWILLARFVIPLQPVSQPVTLFTDYVFILAGVVAGLLISRAPKLAHHPDKSQFPAC